MLRKLFDRPLARFQPSFLTAQAAPTLDEPSETWDDAEPSLVLDEETTPSEGGDNVIDLAAHDEREASDDNSLADTEDDGFVPDADDATDLSAADTPATTDVSSHLNDWVSFSRTQRRVLDAIDKELEVTSQLVEESVGEVSMRFQRLALNAKQQSDQVNDVISSAAVVDVDGKEMPLQELMTQMDQRLRVMVERVVQTSKNGVEIVYALDEVVEDVQSIDLLIQQIEAINKQTVMLSLNARIEAGRAGSNGKAFEVVAQEVKNLSNSINDLADSMREQMHGIADKIRASHVIVQEIANIDLTDNILARDEITGMMRGLMAKNSSFGETLQNSIALADEISSDVAQVITGMQFQDRTKQRLENVSSVGDGVRDRLSALDLATCGSFAAVAQSADVDMEWLKDVVATKTLGEVRLRMVENLGLSDVDLGDDVAATMDITSDGGDVELF